jgi:hypothetical protein
VLLAEQIEHMVRSAEALVEFEDLRFRLASGGNDVEREQMLDLMTAILLPSVRLRAWIALAKNVRLQQCLPQEETIRTEAASEISRRDCRLRYEWEHDYFYKPDDLQRKLELLRQTLDQQMPRYRRSVS